MTQDLSHAFGQPVASSLRGLLPPRSTAASGRPSDPAESADTLPAAAPSPDGDTRGRARGPTSEPAPERSGSDAANSAAPRTPTSTRNAAQRTSTARGRPQPTGTNRRWGVARIASRDHVDLVILLALRQGPADGRGVIDRLRGDSGGDLDAPERTVHRTLHRLTRNRLLVRRSDPRSGRLQYALTTTGTRVARARLREWRAFTRAVEAVVRSGEPD